MLRSKLLPLVVLLVIASTAARAQWVKIPPPRGSGGSAGTPTATGPAPRLSDGRPDLSGIWEPANRYVTNLAADLRPEDVPFQPWAKSLYDERKTGSHSREDPPAHCLPQGVPRINAAPAPWKIVQSPGFIVILYEAFNLWRQIFFDGRELAVDVNPTWLGYSTGKWEGDTLVVETRGFNGKLWLDQLGKPSTDALRVTERFHRQDFGHMNLQITIDDPKAYTRPWTVTEPVRLLTDTELLEFICQENNRDLEHLPGNK